MRSDPERLGPRLQAAGRHLADMGVFAVQIVLAGIDHRKLPECCHVHHFVEQALPQRPIAEERNRHRVGSPLLGREGRTRGDAEGAADNRIGPQIAVFLVGDVHRAPLAAAVALRLAEQLAEHPPEFGALRDAVPVATMRGGNKIVRLEGLADAHGNGFLAAIHVRESRHFRGPVEPVGLVLESADAGHLPVHPQISFGVHHPPPIRSRHFRSASRDSPPAGPGRGTAKSHRSPGRSRRPPPQCGRPNIRPPPGSRSRGRTPCRS